jgi:hypothetical protein
MDFQGFPALVDLCLKCANSNRIGFVKAASRGTVADVSVKCLRNSDKGGMSGILHISLP